LKPLRLLILGFGNVAKRLTTILSTEREKYPTLKDVQFEVVGIFSKRHGYLIENNGIELQNVIHVFDEKKSDEYTPSESSYQSIISAIRELDYDALVELTTLSIEGKGEPAITFVKEALNRGKHVVTANKGPAAFAYADIDELAKKHNCMFLCESAVMDGAPIIIMARTSLLGTRIVKISGILNSTTNYVLSQMEQDISITEAVKIAQQQGIAEADPRNDLDGWDAAAKIAVLANILMDASITPFDVERESIAELDPDYVRKTVQEHKHLKLVSQVKNYSSGSDASVKLQALPKDHPFNQVKDSGSIIRLETDLMGPILITQEAPTLNDTAYGVLNDLITISERD